MSIGFWQLILILFVCFLLFGNVSILLNNFTVFITKIKDFINNNEKKI